LWMLLYLVVLLGSLVYFTGKLRSWIADHLLARARVDQGVRQAVGSIIRYLLIAIGFAIILQTGAEPQRRPRPGRAGGGLRQSFARPARREADAGADHHCTYRCPPSLRAPRSTRRRGEDLAMEQTQCIASAPRHVRRRTGVATPSAHQSIKCDGRLVSQGPANARATTQSTMRWCNAGG
jgi:hypothetical protein